MTTSAGDSSLLNPLFLDEEIAELFSDRESARFMLDVEASLAAVQGRLGVIPADAAATITSAASTLDVDMGRLESGIEKSGVPVIDLVGQLRAQTGKEAADYVHWGATTQDIMDTALVLQLRAALALLEPAFNEVIANLAQLADRHRETLMAGRTHSQQALPITFGLKAAGWLAPLLRQRERLAEIRPRLLVVQFAGAAGTLAALGDVGPEVRRELAASLDLGQPLGAWHTQRDTLVEFANWLSLLTGSLAKMAQDIILMAQSEVGEARESADLSRGGSSTMPQKHNPMVSESILAIHRTNAGHLSALHNALVHEHERATHGWQVEWLNLPPMVIMSGKAIRRAAWLTENLIVNEEVMLKNVHASNGLMLGEAISLALAEYMPRTEAKKLIRSAVQRVLVEERHLIDVLREQVDVPVDWESLRDERNYLGSSEATIDRILKEIK